MDYCEHGVKELLIFMWLMISRGSCLVGQKLSSQVNKEQGQSTYALIG